MSMQISRRALLKGGALIAAGSFLPRFALAAEPGRKVLVFLFLRGALDGLHAVVPVGEPGLRDLRPGLVPEGALPLEPGFALHPSLDALLPHWRNGSLAIVHAVGSPDPTRSHFDAQDYLELGTPGVKATKDGWLARSLRSVRADPSPLEAVALSPRLPRSLQGATTALAFSSPDQLRLHPLAGSPRGAQGQAGARAAFELLYGAGTDEVSAAGKEAFEAVALLDAKMGKPAPLPEAYPKAPLSQPLHELAELIKADVGLRVGCVDALGWDTHVAQPAQLDARLRQLGGAIAAFFEDLGRRGADVVLVAATEFGRTVRQNGANGTDHGHGSIALVVGGAVRGGKILGRWPGLRDDQLYEGRDLAVTTDLRSVLSAAAASQLGARDPQALFPGFSGAPLQELF
jgi:uncharacterized protein (DUF1501 family)